MWLNTMFVLSLIGASLSRSIIFVVMLSGSASFALTKSDVVVAEVTNKFFLVGFKVSTALQMKKPVLLLSTANKVDSVIGVDLNEENIIYSQYNNDNLENIIEEFAQQNIRYGKQVRFISIYIFYLILDFRWSQAYLKAYLISLPACSFGKGWIRTFGVYQLT